MKGLVVTSAAGMLLSSGVALAGGGVHWGYSSESGPEHWGALDPKFEACASGKNQSPIDLRGFVEAELQAIPFSYTTEATEILNNGHTIQVNMAPGSRITVDGIPFVLKQFHFHAPSENRIEGRSFPMEAHLVHADRDGNLAVVAVLFEEGESSEAIARLWKLMPKGAGERLPLPSHFNAADLLPGDRDYYRFDGSLTTPPCTEGVRWLVLKHAAAVSKEQVETFMHVMHHPNNRPVQPLNDRTILR